MSGVAEASLATEESLAPMFKAAKEATERWEAMKALFDKDINLGNFQGTDMFPKISAAVDSLAKVLADADGLSKLADPLGSTKKR